MLSVLGTFFYYYYCYCIPDRKPLEGGRQERLVAVVGGGVRRAACTLSDHKAAWERLGLELGQGSNSETCRQIWPLRGSVTPQIVPLAGGET